MRRSLATVVALLLVAPACTSGSGPVVLTASSLTDVTEALVVTGGYEASVSAAGSQTLVAQVRAGAPADVVLLADPVAARDLQTAGLAGPPRVVATTSLAIAVRPDRAQAVTGPVDLARPELRVVLADATVPLGAYTRDAFRALERSGDVPVDTLDAVLAGADSLEDAARSVLAKVAVGEADAAVVFAADQRLAPDLVFVPWPAPVEVTYTAQVLASSADPAAARAWVTFLGTDEGARAWRSFGFVPTVN